jgi:hypothetical protein
MTEERSSILATTDSTSSRSPTAIPISVTIPEPSARIRHPSRTLRGPLGGELRVTIRGRSLDEFRVPPGVEQGLSIRRESLSDAQLLPEVGQGEGRTVPLLKRLTVFFQRDPINGFEAFGALGRALGLLKSQHASTDLGSERGELDLEIPSRYLKGYLR